VIGWWVLFGFLCLLMIVIGTESAFHFVGPAIDGPFQLYNSLRRIWAGQRAGIDFQFFHGLGLPFLHYPLFRLFGGTFAASEVTRQLMSAVLYPLVLLVFLRFFIRDWTRAVAWSAIVMAASIAFRLSSLTIAVNSLLGVRSTVPTLLPVILCLPVKRGTRVAFTGMALGVALLMGTEQGLAAILAMIVATVVLAIRGRARMAYVIDAASGIAIGVATLVVGLVMVGGVSGMRSAIAYNFRLVPLDQYWYFGSPPNLFMSSWHAIPSLFAFIPRIPIAIAIGIVAIVWCGRNMVRSTDQAEEREWFAFMIFALYGVISCASLLGTFVNVYVQPLIRVLLLLGAVVLDRRLTSRDARLGRAPLFGINRSTVAVSVATVAIMFAVVPTLLTTAFVTTPHWVRQHLIGRIGMGYAGVWPGTIVGGQHILDTHRHPDGKLPTLWSTYAGLLEARNGLFQPGPDYIIHALGPENREKYLNDFERLKPELVQTVMPVYTQYEPWIEQTSWDFYSELLQHYTIAGHTEWSFFWERQPAPLPGPEVVVSAPVPAGASVIDLPTVPGNGGVILLQAELTYRVRNPLRALPMIGATPRYLVRVDNAMQLFPVTLDPYVTTSRFPIMAIRGKAPRLSWNAFSLLPGAHIDVSSVRVSYVPIDPRQKLWFDNLYQRLSGDAPPQ